MNAPQARTEPSCEEIEASNLPKLKIAIPIAGPKKVMNATVGTRATIVRREARERSSTTASRLSAAALRDSRGMIAVRMVTPSTP